jgi:hypothetical protein
MAAAMHVLYSTQIQNSTESTCRIHVNTTDRDASVNVESDKQGQWTVSEMLEEQIAHHVSRCKTNSPPIVASHSNEHDTQLQSPGTTRFALENMKNSRSVQIVRFCRCVFIIPPPHCTTTTTYLGNATFGAKLELVFDWFHHGTIHNGRLVPARAVSMRGWQLSLAQKRGTTTTQSEQSYNKRLHQTLLSLRSTLGALKSNTTTYM